MVHTEGAFTTIDGCRIAWRLDGAQDAPVLILSNSLGAALTMWDDQVAQLGQSFKLLRYDTRGHGGSASMVGDYSLDRLGRDVIALMDHLEIRTAHFCGLSLGGMTGQWLAVHAADRISRLAVANSSAYMGPSMAWQQRIAKVREEGMAEIAQAVLDRWFTPPFLASNALGVDRARTQLLATSPVGYAGCCAAIRDMDLRPIIRLIAIPTLVIAGAKDPATPPEHAEQICSSITGARLAIVEAAHLSNVEQPQAFNRAVLDFLG